MVYLNLPTGNPVRSSGAPADKPHFTDIFQYIRDFLTVCILATTITRAHLSAKTPHN